MAPFAELCGVETAVAHFLNLFDAPQTDLHFYDKVLTVRRAFVDFFGPSAGETLSTFLEGLYIVRSGEIHPATPHYGWHALLALDDMLRKKEQRSAAAAGGAASGGDAKAIDKADSKAPNEQKAKADPPSKQADAPKEEVHKSGKGLMGKKGDPGSADAAAGSGSGSGGDGRPSTESAGAGEQQRKAVELDTAAGRKVDPQLLRFLYYISCDPDDVYEALGKDVRLFACACTALFMNPS